MTWIELMGQLVKLPPHFWKTDAVVTVDYDDEDPIFVEISYLHLNGKGSAFPNYFSDPDLFEMRCFGQEVDDPIEKSYSEELAKDRDKIIDIILNNL